MQELDKNLTPVNIDFSNHAKPLIRPFIVVLATFSISCSKSDGPWSDMDLEQDGK